MSADRLWDASGRVLDGPDEPLCSQHGNPDAICPECIEDWKRREAEFKAWLAEQPAPSEPAADLPW